MSSCWSGSSLKTRARLRSGATTSKDGFSVVAPIRVIVPSSTACSTASCWALLKRWISSMKSIVRARPSRRPASAAAMTLRRSATPLETAERVANRAWVTPAMTRAMDVLPLPGGPQRMQDGAASASMARRSGASGPIKWDWPTNSSSVRGRIRAASGAERSTVSGASNIEVMLCMDCWAGARRAMGLRVAVAEKQLRHCRASARQSRCVALQCLCSTRRDTRGKRGYDGELAGSPLSHFVTAPPKGEIFFRFRPGGGPGLFGLWTSLRGAFRLGPGLFSRRLRGRVG